MLLFGRNELSDAEREEREVERLINKKPPPSRKYTDRRGPKHDNRRQRMKVDDPDLEGGTAESDKDMSLRSREASLFQIAVRIAEDPPVTLRSPGIMEEEEVETKPTPTERMPAQPKEKKDLPPKTERLPKQKPPPPPKRKRKKKEEEPPTQKLPKPPRRKEPKPAPRSEDYEKAKEVVQNYNKKLRDISGKLADKFNEQMKADFLSRIETGDKSSEDVESHVKNMAKNFKAWRKDAASKFKSISDGEKVIEYIVDSWNQNPKDISARAGIIEGIDKAMDGMKIPKSLRAAFTSEDVGKSIKNTKLIKELVNSISEKDINSLDEDVVSKFIQLVSARQKLVDNPDTVDRESLGTDMQEMGNTINEQIHQLGELGMVMDTWREVADAFKQRDPGQEWEPNQDLGPVLDSVDRMFNRWGKGQALVEPSMLMDEFAANIEKTFGHVPEFAQKRLEKYRGQSESRAATSNKIFRIRTMARRVAAYHGVDDLRGNPTDPINTPWRSHDKRYFTEDNYKSIIKAAQDYLKEDWLKHCWNGGAEDAPIRAALDLAVWMADNNLYQAKIDTETYDMLLNRLAKWGYDQFSETILPFKKSKRSAATMRNSSVEKILRIASDIREDKPKESVELIASLRSLVSTDADPSDSVYEHISGEQIGAGVEFEGEEGMSEEEKEEAVKEIKPVLEAIQVADIDALLEALHAADHIKIKEKFGSRLATIVRRIAGLGALEEMSPEAAAAAVEEMKRNESFNKLQREVERGNFDPKLVDEFLKNFDKVIKKQASIPAARISLSTLIKLAYDNPSIRPVLLPIILAAKKKDKKKAEKEKKAEAEKAEKEKKAEAEKAEAEKAEKEKKAEAEKAEKEKKAEAEKKEKAKAKAKAKKKSKKRKASIEREDLNW